MLVSSNWGLTGIGWSCVMCHWNYYLRQSRYDERKATFSEAATDPHGMEVKTEYKFGLGMFVAIVSGVLSACFNFGIGSR